MDKHHHLEREREGRRGRGREREGGRGREGGREGERWRERKIKRRNKKENGKFYLLVHVHV